MSHEAELIERFVAGVPKLRLAIDALTAAELTARPGPGAWSIQELVIHVVDSDLLAWERMKRIIAEDNPTLVVAEENLWVEKLFPDDQSAADACTIFEIGRLQMARILWKLPPEAFERFGTHTTRGRQTLREVLTYFTDHLEHHLTFAFDKRQRLGR
jgi:uncharacterized damage-inducible protein DinB